ncbi:MAG: GGDEF domain-containing protein [Pseudomonadota bacterium]
MGETKRKILTLQQPAAGHQVARAEEALSDISALRARLDAAMQEIESLRKRAESPEPAAVLTRGKFMTRLARRLAPGSAVTGCVVRVALTNFDEVRGTHGDEAAEELCDKLGSWLTGHVRTTDLVGRLGSATYAVFFGFGDINSVRSKMKTLKDRIEAAPVIWNEAALTPSISIEFENVSSETTAVEAG